MKSDCEIRHDISSGLAAIDEAVNILISTGVREESEEYAKLLQERLRSVITDWKSFREFSRS